MSWAIRKRSRSSSALLQLDQPRLQAASRTDEDGNGRGENHEQEDYKGRTFPEHLRNRNGQGHLATDRLAEGVTVLTRKT